MSFRLTIALAIILLVLGGFVYFAQLGRSQEESEPDKRPFIYKVNPDAIVGIKVKYQDQEVSFVKTEAGWVFDEPEATPVDMQRFGGMAYLLGGPRAERVLEEPVDLSIYGLDEPQGTVTVVNRNLPPIVLELGDLNADRTEQFVKRQDDPQVFLVHATWTDVLIRLATEPPYPPAEPEGTIPSP